jgi:hypothetical protein
VSGDLPSWIPEWLRNALSQPTMSVPDTGKAVANADRGQSYALARQGKIPTIPAGRRRRVATVWVRQQLMLD